MLHEYSDMKQSHLYEILFDELYHKIYKALIKGLYNKFHQAASQHFNCHLIGSSKDDITAALGRPRFDVL